jgi:Zn finger protein HypA/HybF involved in hydrogenase expression
MHESGIVKKIVAEAERLAGGETITGITLAVGELASFEAGHLAEHLAEVVDWKIDCRRAEARVKCICGFSGRPRILVREHDLVLFNCPSCAKTPLIESGAEIAIEKIGVKK